MTDVWITIGVLAVVTAFIKATGPVAVGGRDLSPAANRVISLLAPTVLAALIVVETFTGEGGELTVDARALGLAAAAVAIALRTPLLVCVLAAAGSAAAARALGAA
ncbi:MAG TPA: AzlD domain-containing protein [Thermoleophilaceae bacterium]|nr:AzlD domain-containing protein [Thermoleophilaceae bacterium]